MANVWSAALGDKVTLFHQSDIKFNAFVVTYRAKKG
jgi:hypothetical protein